jgi:hypothetical protein
MKKLIQLLGLSLSISTSPGFGQTNSYPPQLSAFSAAKEQQVSQLARELHLAVPVEIKDFFKAAHRGDFITLSNIVDRLGAQWYASFRGATNALPAWMPLWQPLTEVESAYEIFALGGTRYPLVFGEGIIESIPDGSIYFGGSDAGRMLVTALSTSHAEGTPFYTLTQNALADNHYMDYLRGMYGKKINLPTTNEVNQVFEEYKADARRRLEHDENYPGEPRQLARGEDVREVDGELKMTGPVAVMAIGAREVKWILDHNPGPEFYYEESYPQEFLYPYLSPHGLIFKLNHKPLLAVPAGELEVDRTFWSKQFATMLGDWLKPESSVSNVCAFVETIYREKDLSRFTGQREFLTNDFASRAFSKLRVSMAGLYQWRVMKESGTDSARRWNLAANYAFQQAYALCPTSPEVLFRYVDFLTAQRRFDDAILLVHTTLKLTPADDHFYDQYENLMMQLKQYQERFGR